MAKSDFEIASEYSGIIDKETGQAMLYAAALAVVHLLNIAPTELTALGAKFTLASPVLLNGVVAILFLNKLHVALLHMRYFYAFGGSKPLDTRMHRWVLRRHSKPGRSAKAQKGWARFENGAWQALFMPYAMAVFAFLVGSLILAINDLMKFVHYCIEKAPGLQLFRDAMAA